MLPRTVLWQNFKWSACIYLSSIINPKNFAQYTLQCEYPHHTQIICHSDWTAIQPRHWEKGSSRWFSFEKSSKYA
jgi:hypothetical protein